jgi:hypothetical protein
MSCAENETTMMTVRSCSEGDVLGALAMTIAMIAGIASAAEPPADNGNPPAAEAALFMVAMRPVGASPARHIFPGDTAINSRHSGTRPGKARGSHSRRYRCAGGRATCR